MSSLTGTKWTLACIFIRGLKIESGNSSGDGVEQETTKPSLPSLLSAEPSRCTQLFNAFCWNVNRTRPKILTRCVIVAFKGKHCICGETVSHAVCWQWRVMLTSWRTLWFTHRPDNLTTAPPPITGDVSPKVTDIKSDLLPSTWGWYSWQLHRDETKGSKSRAVPLQCLRGFWGWEPPTQRGRGGEGERGGEPLLILGLVVHPKSGGTGAKLHGPDVSGAHTSRQTPFTKLTTFTSRVLLRQMRIFYMKDDSRFSQFCPDSVFRHTFNSPQWLN